MQAIERINLPEPDTHCFDDDTKSDVWSYSRELVISTVLAHIDKLEAEVERLRKDAERTPTEKQINAAIEAWFTTEAEFAPRMRAAIDAARKGTP